MCRMTVKHGDWLTHKQARREVGTVNRTACTGMYTGRNKIAREKKKKNCQKNAM